MSAGCSTVLACYGLPGLKDGLRRVELDDDVVDAVSEGGQHRDGGGGGGGGRSISTTSHRVET